MLYKKKNAKQIAFTSFLLTILALSIFIQIPGLLNSIFDSSRNTFSGQNLLQTSETDYYTKEWITNGDFSSGSTNWTSEIDGDTTDFTLGVIGGAANYVLDGDSDTFNFAQSPINNQSGKWHEKVDPVFPSEPDSHGIDDSEGSWIQHYFQETASDQLVSMNWERNLTASVNLSDYIITSASISAYFNASVYRDIEVLGDSVDYASSYDFARFYIILSDLEKENTYEVAYYQLDDLGLGNSGTWNQLVSQSDTAMFTVSEESLIFYLTSVLSKDFQNFTLALGIRVFCEDNFQIDNDRWDYLLIKNVSLSFTYEKKVDQLSKISWTQIGDTIPSNYEIENATLNFKYQIDNDWNTATGSLNSEFRIIINDNQLGETFKLSTATDTYQDIKIGGIDVANFLSADEDVNISIQIYIGDEFTLDSDITISIDNISLMLDYGIYTPPDTTSFDLFLEEVNRTTEKSTQVTFNEDLNITLIYKDSIGDFIPGADVELTGSGLTPITLSKGTSDYYIIVNSTDLGVGTSYLTLTASKPYYTTQQFQITVKVITRDTEIQLFLDTNNRTIEKEWTTEWNENLNITIRYGDIQSGPFTHINDATVELTGIGPTKTLYEDTGNDQYEIGINTFDLRVGSTFLTVYASKDNYTLLNIRFKITVTTRNTYIDNVLLDTVETNSIEIAWNELFDISVSFNDSSTNNFINGATVELIGTDYSEPLPQSGQSYILTVNTFDLSIGNNFLTLLAQRNNYSIASELITITVEERPTTTDTILNHTSTTAINFPYGELLNITAIYNDLSGPFIDDAIVELREGSTVIYSLQKSSFDQYSVIINTNELSLGVNLLTLYAKQDNYTAAFASITITVDERDTSLEIYLEQTLTTAIEREYDETINISVIYRDFAGAYIDGATVELREGGSTLNSIPEHGSLDQYDLTINTKTLNLGTNLLAIYAKQDNYSAALVSITIIVSERDTIIDIYLKETQTTAIEIMYGEMINFTVIYEDSIGTYIDGADVELREGSTTLDTFSEHGTFDQYFLEMNSDQFSVGSNVLSIYAKKDNYSVSLVSIFITVNERDSTLDVLFNGIDSSTFEIFNISINDLLDITAIYEDITPIFITGAIVELTAIGISETLPMHPTLNQYNYTLNPEDLGVGVHFLVISADTENYTSSIVNIKLNVLERGSNLELYIDGDNLTSSRYLAAEIDQTLNITIQFTDIFDDSFITNADIRLTGALSNNLTENLILQHYNVSVRTNDLDQGINFLTIFAQKQEYESQSIVFTIEVTEKATNLQLFLNGNNETIGKSIEVTVGELVNVSVIYEDYSNKFIDNAEVIIAGEGIDLNLTKHPTYDLYNVTIDTNDLNFGRNWLTLYAIKANYQPQTLIVEIEIIEKETDMHIFLNGLNKTIDRTLTLPIRSSLNVTVKYFDYDTGIGLSGATIQLIGEGLSENMTDNTHQQYFAIINTTQLDIGVRFLTIYAQRANYQSYSALLRIQVDRIQTNITTVSGENVINREPGQSYRFEINLLDLDFNVDVLNATVTYTWTYGQGTLTDPEDDGVYEGTISNLVEGTFVITISVYAGDDYDFDRFTVTLNVVR
ncbi:MAG: hypothetical protein ACTSSK_03425, partial [Candidatus Heimdallarchaeota archaeon]